MWFRTGTTSSGIASNTDPSPSPSDTIDPRLIYASRKMGLRDGRRTHAPMGTQVAQRSRDEPSSAPDGWIWLKKGVSVDFFLDYDTNMSYPLIGGAYLTSTLRKARSVIGCTRQDSNEKEGNR